ncbi:MAG: glycosyltransferase [Cyanobacteriota bacterium]|nr:glycosyltransferase [Cyanobacteriota bacterium]
MGVQFFVLSFRSLASNVVYDAIYNVENIFAKSCDGMILAPKARQLFVKNHHTFESIPTIKNINAKVIDKTIGRYSVINPLDYLVAEKSFSKKVLILFAISGSQLDILSCLPKWRQNFDTVIAYICDSWGFETYSKNIRKIDHLFVALPGLVDPLKKTFGIPVSLVPFASDVLGQGSNQEARGIDVTSFGRMPMQYHDYLFQSFNQKSSPRLYYRFSPRAKEKFPSLPYENRSDRETTNLFYHILRKIRILLAFDTLYPGQQREFPESIITFRWFDGISTGCVLVGKRPTNPLMNELFDWEDSTIEIPDSPEQSPEFIEDLLKDADRIKQISRRNYYHSVCKHDWRFRIKAILEEAQLPLPTPLINELEELKLLRLRLEQEEG